MFRTPLVWLTLLATVAALPAGQPDPKALTDREFDQLKERVQAKLDDLRAKAEFPGVSVGFVLADGRSTGLASGLADVENKVPLKPGDRLLAGSIGKTFVAAVILQLVEEGKIGLDDRLEKWLGDEPWFGRLPNAKELTIRSLLNHTAGLPEYFERKGFVEAIKADPDRVWKPSELMAYMLDAKPLFAVGKGWSYADTDYILAGMAAEKAAGKPLFAEVERRLLKPFELEKTVPSDQRMIAGLATGYARPGNPLGFEGRTVKDGKFVTNPQFEWAGGGLASTPEDLARWAKALYEGKVFKKKETLEAMLAGVDATGGRGGGKGNRYGLGVQLRESKWGPSYGHGGWFPGYLSEVEYFPDHKVAIAVQFNTDLGKSIKKGLRAYVGDVAEVILASRK
jgi:D-alanyl-D-alanine carboxypeptidase